eukprot:GILK01010363.1.p1 GENE.GILK01010363.1~~GILK01010363.1.p1  ORF type:complete len:475 (-),score=39.29 GILK01010363.1:97-1521(-)
MSSQQHSKNKRGRGRERDNTSQWRPKRQHRLEHNDSRRSNQAFNTTSAVETSSTSSSSHATSSTSTVRNIPGFYWDAEKQRYFPITSNRTETWETFQEKREARVVKPPTPKVYGIPFHHCQQRQVFGSTMHRSWRQVRHKMFTLPDTTSVTAWSFRPVVKRRVENPYPLYTPYVAVHPTIPFLVAGSTSFGIYDVSQTKRPKIISDTIIAQSQVMSMSWHQSVPLLAVAHTSGTTDGRVCILWDDDFKIVMNLAVNGCPFSTAWAGKRSETLAIGVETCIHLTNTENFSLTGPRYRIRSAPLTMTFDEVKNSFLVGCRNGSLQRLDPRAKRLAEISKLANGAAIFDLKLLNQYPDQFIASFINHDLTRWDARMLKRPLVTYPEQFSAETGCKVTVDPAEKLVFAGAQDKCIRIWDLANGKLIRSFPKMSAVPKFVDCGKDIKTDLPVLWVGVDLDFIGFAVDSNQLEAVDIETS